MKERKWNRAREILWVRNSEVEGEGSVREKARWTTRRSEGGGERQMVRLEKRRREEIQ